MRADCTRGVDVPIQRLLCVVLRHTWSFLRSRRSAAFAEAGAALVQGATTRVADNIGLLRSIRCYIAPARAPTPLVSCSDRGATVQLERMAEDIWTRWLLYEGNTEWAPVFNDKGGRSSTDALVQLVERKSQRSLLSTWCNVWGHAPVAQPYALATALTDSGKLRALDQLLVRLKAEGHRVLIFSQMTKMLDLLEDYMHYRKHRYFRLDGSSAIDDRRDMVKQYQTDDSIFVFILSTRAGGLGINLTAADTVIFYESDWNPTIDLQAMDRAHRLGQTRPVTVYRLTCRGTIEEKVLKRAAQKNTVQQLVITHSPNPHLNPALTLA